MQISYQWLQKHISISETAQEIAALLTKSGLEVEKVYTYESIKGGLEGFVIGEVLTCSKHPSADKLSITSVGIGNGVVLPIVCGAPNVAQGQKVIVATVGTMLYPLGGEPFKISKAKIRGEVSEGMICAEDEIGIGNSHDGILVLNTQLPIGTPAAEYFNLTSDQIFEIGLTPNRADAASHLGVARDLKVLLNRPLLKFDESLFENKISEELIQIEVINKEACPRYCGITISDIKVAPSPSWLQNALKSIGVAPINNIVDITNFILHDLGQPLHAFDLLKISGNKVIVKNVESDTRFITLDGVERKLSSEDLMICNANEPMCIAGVFGGKASGVSTETNAIFLESAYFAPDSIRKTSLRHGLKTDASFRYERGTDPEIPMIALKKAISMIIEIAGGKVSSKPIDIYPKPIAPFPIETSYSYINKLIGKKIDSSFIDNTLKALDISIISKTDEKLTLSVPSYRVDVRREADITEEILRIYGYDNIELSPNLSPGYIAPLAENNSDKIQKIISDFLVGRGCYEMITNSLTKSVYSQFLGVSTSDVKILNPLSETLDVMRQSLVFSGLEVVLHNVNRKKKDLKLYEFGKTYHLHEGKYIEHKKLGIFFTGNTSAEQWKQKSTAIDFYEVKNLVFSLLSKLGITKYELNATSENIFAQRAKLVARQKDLVKFGLLSKQVLKLADIKQEVFYCEFDLDLLEKMHNNKVVFQELPKFPEVRRDLSVLIDKQITYEQIKNLILKTERNLIKEINVFDIYEGEKIAELKKSYSVSFILQNAEQTMTDELIDKVMNKLINALEKDLGAVIRK